MSLFTRPDQQTFRELIESDLRAPSIERSNFRPVNLDTIVKLGVIDPASLRQRNASERVSKKKQNAQLSASVAGSFPYMRDACEEVERCFVLRFGQVAVNEEALTARRAETLVLAGQLSELDDPKEFCSTVHACANTLSHLKAEFSKQFYEIRAKQKPIWWRYLDNEHSLPYPQEAKAVLSLMQGANVFEFVADQLKDLDGVGSLQKTLNRIRDFHADSRTKALYQMESLRALAAVSLNPYYLAEPEALARYVEKVGPYNRDSRLYDHEKWKETFDRWRQAGADTDIMFDHLPRHRDLGPHSGFPHMEEVLTFNGHDLPPGPEVAPEDPYAYDRHDQATPIEPIKIDPEVVIQARQEFQEFVERHEDVFELGQAASRLASHLRSFMNLSTQRIAPFDLSLRLAEAIVCQGYAFSDVSENDSLSLSEYLAPTALIPRTNYINPMTLLFGTEKKKGYVPLSVASEPEAKGLLFSGSNMAGKSIAAQSIVIAHLERQAGLPQKLESDTSHLRAASSFDALVPDSFQFRDGLGFFASTMKELCSVAENSPEGTVIFLDEVPAGTDYKELCSVMCALYEDYANRNIFIVGTGHLKQAMTFLATRGFQPFQMEARYENGEIIPTYTPTEGVAERSMAIERMVGAGFPAQAKLLADQYYHSIMEPSDSAPEFDQDNSDSQPEASSSLESSDLQTVVYTLQNLFPAEFFVSEDSCKALLQSLIQPSIPDEKKLENRYADINSLMELGDSKCRGIQEHLATISDEGARILEELAERPKDAPPPSSLNTAQLKLIVGQFESYLATLDVQSQSLEDLIDGLSRLITNDTSIFGEQSDEVEELSIADVFIGNWKISSSNIHALDMHLGASRAALSFSLRLPTYDESYTFSMDNALPFQAYEGGAFFNTKPFIDNGVAQSLRINSDGRITAILGPNGSGKSVALWTARLNALLALHRLPCSGNVHIGPYKRVLAFFGAESSRGTSYFESALKNTAILCRGAAKDSLLIMDELHGSDYFEMAAIQLGTWHYCAEQGATILADTHLRSGLAEARETLPLQILKTDYEFDPNKIELKPFYTVSPDPEMTAQSLGLAVARMLMTESQFDRACEVYRELFDEEPFSTI